MFHLSFAVTTKSRPFLRPGSPSNRTLYRSENTTLHCYDVLSSLTDFRWYHWLDLPPTQKYIRTLKDGVSLSRSHNGTMIEAKYYRTASFKSSSNEPHGVSVPLYNVSEHDAGWYSCVACNFMGCSMESAFIKVIRRMGEFVFISSPPPSQYWRI